MSENYINHYEEMGLEREVGAINYFGFKSFKTIIQNLIIWKSTY